MTDTPTTAAEMREAAAAHMDRRAAEIEQDPMGNPTLRHLMARVFRDEAAALRAIPLPSGDEMEERVARSLFAAEFYEQKAGPVFVSPDDERWKAWIVPAQAAIAAMRGE